MLKLLQLPADTNAHLGAHFVSLGLSACILALSACGPQTPALPPPEPRPFTEAEIEFGVGDYVSAANAYHRSLLVTDTGIEVDREQALYRLALVHALPDSPLEDTAQAQAFLDELVTEFPDTSREVEIRSLLALQSSLLARQSTIDALSSTIESLRSTMSLVETSRDEQTNTIGQLNDQLEQLEERLEATETELEKLKDIDLGRRPRE